jgi:isocitrate dehydrogenase
MIKDNIMKLTDGLFYKVFQEIGEEYPDIQKERYIIDIGTARIASRPEHFDVIVTPNLYGDIISDVAAEVTGSVGLGGSANIGEHVSMFEAIHGSAPDLAGKDIANPSGLILAAVQMLVHIRQADAAARVHNAWLKTIEDGIHTGDLRNDFTKKVVGTQGFADAVVERMGQDPSTLKVVSYKNPPLATLGGIPAHGSAIYTRRPPAKKQMVGVDVFIHAHEATPDFLAGSLSQLSTQNLKLQMITNRGVKVWPNGFPETFCTDHWRCRFVSRSDGPIEHTDIVGLLDKLTHGHVDVIKTENLCTFDGELGYALGAGQDLSEKK